MGSAFVIEGRCATETPADAPAVHRGSTLNRTLACVAVAVADHGVDAGSGCVQGDSPMTAVGEARLHLTSSPDSKGPS